jgi:hypothetical protein
MAGSPIPNGGGKVVLNFKGMGELLRSEAMGSILLERMARVQAAVPGSKLETRKRRSRIAAIVQNGSDYDEANTGTLSRALDLAGGERGIKIKLSKPRRRSNG